MVHLACGLARRGGFGGFFCVYMQGMRENMVVVCLRFTARTYGQLNGSAATRKVPAEGDFTYEKCQN